MAKKKKIKSFLSTPRRYLEGAEVQRHPFLTSALELLDPRTSHL